MYQLEIKFDNISKFSTRPLERDNIQIMITLRRPAKCLLKTKEGFKEVPSPFRFVAEDKMFLNAWNMKQVIFIEGTLELTQRLETLIKVVQSTDLVPKISPMTLGNVRVLDINEPKCKELHAKMQENNERFNKALNKLVVPIRFSILALLSAKKCTVFDDSLINLMNYISRMRFQGAKIYKMRYTPAVKVEGEEEEKSSLLEEPAAIVDEDDSDEEYFPPAHSGGQRVDGNLFYLSNEKYQ